MSFDLGVWFEAGLLHRDTDAFRDNRPSTGSPSR